MVLATLLLTQPGTEDLIFQFLPMTCKVILGWRSTLSNLLTRYLRVDRSDLTSDLIVARVITLR